MFHVERYPINKLPPVFRSASHQVVNIRIDHLQGQRLREGRRRTAFLTVNVNLQPHFAISHTKSDLPGTGIRLAEHEKFIHPMTDQLLRICAAERTTTAEIRNSLQDTGLSGGVRPVNKIVPGTKFERDGLQAPEIRTFKAY